jgi:hypothetical protein
MNRRVVTAREIMATITGGSVSPVLQAQDGSFVGEYVAGYDANYNYVYNMVSFDAAGNVRWIVPNEQPQIATDDGGVIGQSGITYDSGGNATGQLSLLTQSWRGNLYQDGAVQQVDGSPAPLAESYSPLNGTNASDTPTAVLRVPTTLVILVVGRTPADCYSSLGNAGTGSLAQRNITYIVDDQYGGEMLHMRYRETLQPGPGTTWCPGATALQNGLCVGLWVSNWFEDQLSANPGAGHQEYTQTFWVATPPNTPNFAAFYGQIPRIDAYQSSPSSSNSLDEIQFVITVNGNTGMGTLPKGGPNGIPIRSCN